MRAKQLLKMYPEQWATVEASVWDDGKYQAKRLKLAKLTHPDFSKMMRVVAYNAAFIAVSLIHEAGKKKKTGVS